MTREHALGSGSCVEEEEEEVVVVVVVVLVVVVVVVVVVVKPSFTDALRAFESMRASMYAHDITERDQANFVNIESLLFNLKWKGATKQMKINDFLKKNAKWTLQWKQ
jgi:hypothetical protein